MFETSKSDHFCSTPHRHRHSDLSRTVANGCKRLRTVADGCEHKSNVERTHPNPQTPKVKRGPFDTHSGKRGAKLGNEESAG